MDFLSSGSIRRWAVTTGSLCSDVRVAAVPSWAGSAQGQECPRWTPNGFELLLPLLPPRSLETSSSLVAQAEGREKCACEPPQDVDPRVAAWTADTNSAGISRSASFRPLFLPSISQKSGSRRKVRDRQ